MILKSRTLPPLCSSRTSYYSVQTPHALAGSAVSSKKIGPLDVPGGLALAPPLTDWTSRRQLSQGFDSQTQDPERLRDVNPMPPQQASQKDSPCTQDSSYSPVDCTRPTVTEPTSQTQSLISNDMSSSSLGSTFPQKAYGAEAFGQGQCQTMTLNPEQGWIQIPVDKQTASRFANDKRKRNAIASTNFRLRRKKKENEDSEEIANLKAKLREMTEERDLCRRQLDEARSKTQTRRCTTNDGCIHLIA